MTLDVHSVFRAQKMFVSKKYLLKLSWKDYTYTERQIIIRFSRNLNFGAQALEKNIGSILPEIIA